MEGRLPTGKTYTLLLHFIFVSGFLRFCPFVLKKRSGFAFVLQKYYNTLCKRGTVSLVNRELGVPCRLTHRAFILHLYDKEHALTKDAVA